MYGLPARLLKLLLIAIAASLLLSFGHGQALAGPASDYPPDPISDIGWTGGTSGVADIQTAFNAARVSENTQLGKNIPLLTLPSQSTWNGMSNTERAFWLINRERIDRGVMPMHGPEANVTSVAQTYAQYLLDHNAWGHTADGRDPWQRLAANPAIGACHDFLSVSENIAVLATSGNSISLPVESPLVTCSVATSACASSCARAAV